MDKNDGDVRGRGFRSSGAGPNDFPARMRIGIRRRNYAELRCSDCHCRYTEDVPAIMVDFLRHISSLALPDSAIALPSTRTFRYSAIQPLWLQVADHSDGQFPAAPLPRPHRAGRTAF
ncbi:hypothetical protein [Bradyrhizobium sp. SEMIA]|uniref:hypothetical protein n=1 Tax=Bradyrhizobium sp. SEMIA TaxID=2597515 RepID=UPI00223FC504|nr:hypothetical protein [Bradyrhizobium sp. SEMIA]